VGIAFTGRRERDRHPGPQLDFQINEILGSFLGVIEQHVFLVFLVDYNQHTAKTPVQQERIRMVRGSKLARKNPTELNSTPSVDLELGTDHVGRHCGMTM